MHTLRRVLVFAAVSAVSMFAWAMPAHAVVAAECAIGGHADAAVMLMGGTGTYGFVEFTASCAVAANKKNPPEEGVASLDITSNGTFTNTVCGTGQAADSDPTVDATVTSDNSVNAAALKAELEGANLAYSITFAAGVGDLEFTDPAVEGGGAISISPDGDVVSSPQCVDGFNVVGDVAGVIS